MTDILCLGEVLWDCFPQGAELGGASCNVAYHLGQLGADVALVSRVGDDELGRAARARLEAAGVRTELVQIDGARATGRVNVELVDGEPRYSLRRGAAWEFIDVGDDVARAMASARVFCYGSLIQRSPSGRQVLADALAICPAEVTRVFDMNLRAGHFEMDRVVATVEKTDVAKLNDDEAELLAARVGVTDVADWLLGGRGLQLVVLTHGSGGCTLISQQERVTHPGFAALPGGDNVGAGDAFVAGLALGLVASWSLPEIAERCNRLGAFVASHGGATPPMSPDLRERITAAPIDGDV